MDASASGLTWLTNNATKSEPLNWSIGVRARAAMLFFQIIIFWCHHSESNRANASQLGDRLWSAHLLLLVTRMQWAQKCNNKQSCGIVQYQSGMSLLLYIYTYITAAGCCYRSTFGSWVCAWPHLLNTKMWKLQKKNCTSKHQKSDLNDSTALISWG